MGKRLVAFFSASGTTKKVAEMIASAVQICMRSCLNSHIQRQI